ncbi:deoxyribose-phosphate aldolase [Rhodovibrio salinarum]|uniref:Deoxyribose-phosphate aldolase n=1 Tax=Rhodovibrio salinarum TaxID=1087 RepID=A0A934UYW7_9PROT|nr:deoxyribose-phosphate aldolase [Rhodovibrio salinarum]MBK1696208.1 2-deoxyribose-5-phosphate aldolase [Rhodovibrio salinarum]
MTLAKLAHAEREAAQARNPGCALHLDWLAEIRVNRAAAERRAATVTTRRSVKGAAQAAWLVKALTCTDLTTLNSDDTPGRVRRLCSKARRPLDPALLDALGLGDRSIQVGAVCVYHAMVPTAVAALEGTSIPVAAVAAGFPHGLSPMRARRAEVEESVAAGASEIDIVISRQHVLRRDWQALYEEVAAFREVCGPAHLKAILGTGDLKTLRDVARASLVAMMAGADFVKTSTGKEAVNATLPVALVMARTVRAYAEATGYRVGFKPAGGISTAKDALAYQTLMREELGRPWLEPDLFRIGASGLVGDIERQLTHFTTGAYAAGHRHALA